LADHCLRGGRRKIRAKRFRLDRSASAADAGGSAFPWRSPAPTSTGLCTPLDRFAEERLYRTFVRNTCSRLGWFQL